MYYQSKQSWHRTINRAANLLQQKCETETMNNQVIAVLSALIFILHNGYEVRCSGGNSSKNDLHFSFITALTGGSTSSGGIPVIDFALEQINNDSRLLPDYNLRYTQVLDSKVRWLGILVLYKSVMYCYAV